MSADFDLNALLDQPQELIRSLDIRPGAKVTVRYLSRAAWDQALRPARQMKGSAAARTEAIKALTRRTLAKAITGWEGFTPQVVAEFLPVDPAALPPELPHNNKNAEALLAHSGEFHDLVSLACDDLAGFRELTGEEALEGSTEEELKN